MKKRLVAGLLFLTFLLVAVSSVSAYSNLPSSQCNGVSIKDRCYSSDELGKCIPIYPRDNTPGSEVAQFCSSTEGACSFSFSGGVFCGGIYCWKEGAKCKWENFEIVRPLIYVNSYPIGISSSKTISITDDMLNDTENINIPITIFIKNSYLPSGIEASLNIYNNGDYNQPINVIPVVIDQNGDAVAEWAITKEVLDSIGYDGSNQLDFRLLNSTSGADLLSNTPTPFEETLIITSRVVECTGTFSCGLVSTQNDCEALKEGYGFECTWNSETNSCTGEASCGLWKEAEECKAVTGCSLKYSIWTKILGWFKNLFG